METILLFHTHDHTHETVGEALSHVLLDSVVDVAKMLPFLFVAYLIIEYLEHKQGDTIQRWLARGGRFGFVPGALLGVVPQCGFSAMAANFYSSRVITLGTLLAVFLSTSDEAIPIMLAQPDSYGAMLKLIGAKLVYALLVGFILDILLARFIPASLRGGYKGKAEEVDCHDHNEKDSVLLAAAKHTANILIWLFAFTFLFGLLVEWVGQSRITDFLTALGPIQPVVAGLFGLVPNCASSVLLTQLFLSGSISFGSVLAGLCTNAGVGLVVLFKTNKSLKQNLFILGLLYLLGTAFGLVVHLLGF